MNMILSYVIIVISVFITIYILTKNMTKNNVYLKAEKAEQYKYEYEIKITLTEGRNIEFKAYSNNSSYTYKTIFEKCDDIIVTMNFVTIKLANRSYEFSKGNIVLIEIEKREHGEKRGET